MGINDNEGANVSAWMTADEVAHLDALVIKNYGKSKSEIAALFIRQGLAANPITKADKAAAARNAKPLSVSKNFKLTRKSR